MSYGTTSQTNEHPTPSNDVCARKDQYREHHRKFASRDKDASPAETSYFFVSLFFFANREPAKSAQKQSSQKAGLRLNPEAAAYNGPAWAAMQSTASARSGEQQRRPAQSGRTDPTRKRRLGRNPGMPDQWSRSKHTNDPGRSSGSFDREVRS